MKSIRRALRILASFNITLVEIGVTEASELLGCSKSTAHRTLSVLEEEGFVRQDLTTRKYVLGPKVLELAAVLSETTDVRLKSLPHMESLRQATNETVTLGLVVDNSLVFIEELVSSQSLRYSHSHEMGRPLELYAGAAGKTLFAHLPQSEIDYILNEAKLVPIGPSTIVDPKQLREELARIRERGFGISVEERVPGAAGIAAPVRNHTGNVIACVGLFGPKLRFEQTGFDRLAELVVATAAAISADMGYGVGAPATADSSAKAIMRL
ncbi:MAG: IclR family transcriptional regulator [Anaerolineae bacterium]